MYRGALWRFVEVDGRRIGALNLLTAVINAVVDPVHHRVAAILPTNAEVLWLFPATPVKRLRMLLAACNAAVMTAIRVGTLIHRVVHNDADLKRPAAGGSGNAWLQDICCGYRKAGGCSPGIPRGSPRPRLLSRNSLLPFGAPF